MSKKEALEKELERVKRQRDTYAQTLADTNRRYLEKIEELSLVRHVGDSLRYIQDVERVCRAIVDIVQDELDPEKCSLMLIDTAGERVCARAERGPYDDESHYFDEEASPRSFRLGEGIAGIVARDGNPVLVPDTLDDPRFLRTRPEDQSIRSLLCLPLIAREKILGVFNLSSLAPGAFGPDQERILPIILGTAAIALTNVILFNDLQQSHSALETSEGEARATKEYLEKLLETASDIIFTVGRDGRFTYLNKRVETWGFTREELRGEPLSRILPGGERFDELRAALGRGEMRVFEIGVTDAAGESRCALVSTSPLRGASGDVEGALIIARDITERKRLERQLMSSEKLASLGRLAAGVAHEVRNPLSSISGYVQILMKGKATEEMSREFLTSIDEQIERINRIIENLLSFSRTSKGKVEFVDVNTVIEKTLTLLYTHQSFKNIRVSKELADGLPAVRVDRYALEEILMNITMNAADAMSGGGTLTVRTGVEEGGMGIVISDTGSGIAPEDIDKIFDPFFTTKPEGYGTGLGLSICLGIVEKMGGAIRVESEPGKGATFFVTLPVE